MSRIVNREVVMAGTGQLIKLIEIGIGCRANIVTPNIDSGLATKSSQDFKKPVNFQIHLCSSSKGLRHLEVHQKKFREVAGEVQASERIVICVLHVLLILSLEKCV